MNGDWLIDFDPSRYSAQELKEMLSLKYLPTGYSKVVVEAGTEMRAGVAAAVPGWGSGGAAQLEIVDGWKNSSAIFNYAGPLK